MEHTLGLPADALHFAVSQKMGELFPGQIVRLASDRQFRLGKFLRYAYGEAEGLDCLWQEVWIRRGKKGESPSESVANALVRIVWSGSEYHALTFQCDGCTQHAIVGPTERAVSAFFCAVERSSEVVEREILVYSSGLWNSDSELAEELNGASFDALDLPDSLVGLLTEQVDSFFDAKDEYARYGIIWKRGLLLTGSPGNGKTQAIRAIAGRLRVPRLFVRDFKDCYGYEGAGVADVFEKARESAPCLLIIEDIDSLVHKHFLSQVLNQMDGIKPLNGVLTIATSNYPERLDPALRCRPSRFDRLIQFSDPKKDARSKLLRNVAERWDPAMAIGESELGALSKATKGFSYAQLRELTLAALPLWMQERKPGSMGGIMLQLVAELRKQFEQSRATDDEN